MKQKEEEKKVSNTYDEIMEKAVQLNDPKKLFGSLWRKNQLCIMFAKTGVGKSLLAMQIGHSISKGIPIQGFELEVPAQPILFFNYEVEALSLKVWDANKKQFESNKDFHFAKMNKYQPSTSEIIDIITASKMKIIIIDNLTRITGFAKKQAVNFVNELHELKDRLGLSILLITHMPKSVKQTQPIGEEDAWGSSLVMNRASTSFAVVQSDLEPNWRYLKQTKSGPYHNDYTADSVAIFEVVKPEAGKLQFQFLKVGEEEEHLVKKAKERKAVKLFNKAQLYHELPQTFSKLDGLKEARKFTMSERTFMNWLKEEDGELFQKVGKKNWEKIKTEDEVEDDDTDDGDDE